MASVSPIAIRLPETDNLSAIGQPEIERLMRGFFELNRNEADEIQKPAQPEPVAQIARAPRDFGMATELLKRASKAFDLLMDRCQRLESDLDQEAERSKIQAAEQAETVEQWKRLASGLKAQAEASEQAVVELKQRFEAAEAKAVLSEQRVRDLERTSAQAAEQAVLAEQLSTKLHDEVIVAFGAGSQIYPVIEAVAKKEVAGAN